jgi:hypothetical protein
MFNMLKCKNFKFSEGLPLNYDNIYIIPSSNKNYTAFYRDMMYTFKDSDAEEFCDKINSIGCTSFQLSVEDLLKIIEGLKYAEQ